MPIRNPYACHPLLRKGGPHIKSRTGQRRRVKDNLLDEADEYMLERLKDTDKSTILLDNENGDLSESSTEQDQGGVKPPFLFIQYFSLFPQVCQHIP